MIDQAQALVKELLSSDNSGHGMDHINRVLNLSLKFAQNQPADTDVISLIALLHDVDDYKLFGAKNAENLTNASKILNDCGASDEIKVQAIDGIKTIGYSKRLQGVKPTTLEAQIVSDADMCDAMGATGVIRSLQYNIAHGSPFFDRDVFPALDMSAEEYRKQSNGTTINHLFEKLLKLKDLMLTKPGQKEATKRYDFMVNFLYHFFEEENTPEWTEYLDDYLKQ